MNLTSRSRYALKIMLDMARHESADLVKRHDIVVRQGVPEKYLDQIMIRLRRAGLVTSVRGRLGGYRMGRPASDISAWDVFRAVEDGLYPVLCVDEAHGPCNFKHSCSASEPWRLIFQAVQGPLQNLRLSDMAAAAPETEVEKSIGARECPPGRSAPLETPYRPNELEVMA